MSAWHREAMSKRKVSTRVKEKLYLYIVRSAITFPVIVFPQTPTKIYLIQGIKSSFLCLIVLDMGPRLVVETLIIELIHVGAWRSLVAYLNGVQRAGGSNPLAPTINNLPEFGYLAVLRGQDKIRFFFLCDSFVILSTGGQPLAD